jgi:formiminoglutamase
MSSAWPNLSELLVEDAAAPVDLIGAPLAAGSVTPGRCDMAPAMLRAVLKRIGRYDLDSGRELSTRIADLGDLKLPNSIVGATVPITRAVADSVASRTLTLLIGGNNAVTRPGLLGMAEGLGLPLGKVGLITLDAHFDLRDLDAGLSNGNPVRALREDGLPGANVVQIGLAPFANSREMHDYAKEGGHLVISAAEVREQGIGQAVDEALDRLHGVEAILLDCDIDVLDRSDFPGAPGARPGGMAFHDFAKAVRRLAAEPKVRVIDLTEWDPPLDPTAQSPLVAGRWLAEVLAGFERRS